MSTKNVVIAVLVAIFAVALIGFITRTSINNSAADAETMVINSEQDCASTYDNGIKAVIEQANVDISTKNYLKSLFTPGSGATVPAGQSQQVQQAYSQFVNGNPAQLFLMLGAIGKTDFTVTATNVQREITSQRAAMLDCSRALNRTQRNLRNIVGMNAAGQVVKFPQNMFHLDYPSEVSDPVLQDNDKDGRLTVLDYRPPVDVSITNSFGTGAGIPPVNPYGTAQP